MLRRLLVQCAHYTPGPFRTDSDLRWHGEKIAARGGKNANKRAVGTMAPKAGGAHAPSVGDGFSFSIGGQFPGSITLSR